MIGTVWPRWTSIARDLHPTFRSRDENKGEVTYRKTPLDEMRTTITWAGTVWSATLNSKDAPYWDKTRCQKSTAASPLESMSLSIGKTESGRFQADEFTVFCFESCSHQWNLEPMILHGRHSFPENGLDESTASEPKYNCWEITPLERCCHRTTWKEVTSWSCWDPRHVIAVDFEFTNTFFCAKHWESETRPHLYSTVLPTSRKHEKVPKI